MEITGRMPAEDLKSRDEVASSAARLADILENPNERIPLYMKAVGIWGGELAQSPANGLDLMKRVALMYRDLASAFVDAKQFEKAIDYATRARDLDGQLLQRDLASPVTQMNLAFDVLEIGAAYRDLGDYAKAEKYFNETVVLRQRVADANRDDRRAADRVRRLAGSLAVGRAAPDCSAIKRALHGLTVEELVQW